MSLEGTIRDLGLQEVGQLLSLSRKSGTLLVSSLLRGTGAWIRFVDGAMVDAADGQPLPPGEATAAAVAGTRAEVEEAVLDVLAWRDGRFKFQPEPAGAGSASSVRIPTDAMLVESVRREDAWSALRDRVPSADVVPSFVDVEPKALPLLRLVPQEWEVLTRVDGQRNLRTLAQLLERDLLEVAAIVHRLVGTGLLTVREVGGVRRSATTGSLEIVSAAAELPPPRVDGREPDVAPREQDEEEVWIPAMAEMAVFEEESDPEDLVFDPQRAGLLTPHGTPSIDSRHAMPARSVSHPTAASGRTVTRPAPRHVASSRPEPSSVGSVIGDATTGQAAAGTDRDLGDAAARRGDFETALMHWSRYLRSPQPVAQADRVREAIGLAARLQALLYPTSRS
jgi:hypothetical protein